MSNFFIKHHNGIISFDIAICQFNSTNISHGNCFYFLSEQIQNIFNTFLVSGFEEKIGKQINPSTSIVEFQELCHSQQ